MGTLVGTVSQQSSDIPHTVKFRIIFNVEKLDVAVNGQRENGLCHVDNVTGGPAANRTEAHQVSVEVAAGGTFHSLRGIVLGYK